MKHEQNKLILTIFTLFGFFIYLFHYPLWSPLIFIPFIVFLISLASKKSREKGSVKHLFPYISGLLIFPMKLFWWDKVDFSGRVGNLLLITFVFFIYSFIKKNRVLERGYALFTRRSMRSRLVILFLLSQLIFITASGIIVLKGVELVGDEPHYLAISQSIAKDGDLNVFNQYARDEYREFIDYRLTHHSKVGKGFKKWYSFHLPGLSFTLAPFFLLKISTPFLYFLVRVFLGLFGSMLGILVYLLTLKIWNREKLSFFIYFVFMFTAPVFFYSFHIFAELQALLLLLSSLWFALFKSRRRKRDILFAGFLLGMTVFWGMKYLIFISIFIFLFFIKKTREKDIGSAFLFAAFPSVFLALFFIYLYSAYGNFSPMSVYTGVLSDAQRAEYNQGMQSITVQNRIETLFDYFFDQRDGLILYNPFYIFFFPGLILAFRKIRKYAPHILISAASFVYLLYHGYSTVRPGYCPQARYLLPVAWTLMLFSIIYYIESRNRVFRKIFILIPFVSFFTVLYQIFNPFTLYQSTTHNYLDRSGLLFQKLGNIYFDFSSILPSFIKVDGNFKYVPNLIFLIFFVLFIIFSLWKSDFKKTIPLGPFLFIILFSLFSLFPRVTLFNPIKFRTNEGVPFLIHGNQYPRSDISDSYVLVSKSSSTKAVTLSTIKPLKKIDLHLSGHTNEGTIEIINFARPLQEIGVRKGENKVVTLEDLRYIKKGGRIFYTLNFKFCYCLEGGINIRIIPF